MDFYSQSEFVSASCSCLGSDSMVPAALWRWRVQSSVSFNLTGLQAVCMENQGAVDTVCEIPSRAILYRLKIPFKKVQLNGPEVGIGQDPEPRDLGEACRCLLAQN